MKFIELLEKGDNVEAIKEMKSKLDGLKSGALIDKEQEIAERITGKKEEQ